MLKTLTEVCVCVCVFLHPTFPLPLPHTTTHRAKEEDAVVAHNALLEKMIAEHKHDTHECRRELDTALHDRTAATMYEDNPQNVLKRLLHESSQIEVSLGGMQKQRQQQQQQHIIMIVNI